MGRAVKINIDGLKEFKENLEKKQVEIDRIFEILAKDVAALLLRKVKKRTPVKEGRLRNGWTIGDIKKEGGKYIVEVINPVEYASYVEFGHRQEVGRFVPTLGKKLKKPWVDGKFMLTISENEVKEGLESFLTKRIEKAIKKVFADGR